jgi:molecular chaperone DnaK (HSP70)
VAHPSGWGTGRLGLLQAGLAEADLMGCVPVTRARAVVECHQAAGRAPAAGGLLGVYRLGGSTAEVALVAPQQPGRMELLASAELSDVGGFEVDGLSPADARALIRPTVDLAAALVRSRGFGTEELSAVLIAGAEGTVGTYVSDLLAAVFPAPVLRDPQPRMTVALGAALAGRPAVPVNPQAVAGGPTDAFAILPAGHHVAVRADVR